MRKQKHFFILTLVISVLVGIILPLAITSGPIDWGWFFLVMALSFSLTWAIYSIILLGYVFLVEGERNKSEIRKEEDPISLHSTKELDALWEITAKRYKDPGVGNPNWN